jgi:hypothetical protein
VETKQTLKIKWQDLKIPKPDIKTKEYSDCSYEGHMDEEGLRHGWGKLVF